MSITGLSAQSINSDPLSAVKVLFQGAMLGLFLAFVIIVLQSAVVSGGLYFAQASVDVAHNVQAYFYTRVWGAPGALINMVLIGWLIGQQKTKYVLVLQIIINLANILLSLLFVYGFDLGVTGVAAATVVAEYLMMFAGLVMVQSYLRKQRGFTLFSVSGQSRLKLSVLAEWSTYRQLKLVLSVNSHMFVRNIILQFTLAFITLKGAQYGAQAAAINAIIMQFFALIALGLDGIANAVEALIGEAKSLKDKLKINLYVQVGLLWSSLFAIVYSLLFYFLDSLIISFLTHHSELIGLMADYAYIVVLIPLVSHWCYLFDGVFVGLSLGKPMRDSMFISTVFGFLPTWWIWQQSGNISLWFAMLVFLSFRGLLLGSYYVYLYQKKSDQIL